MMIRINTDLGQLVMQALPLEELCMINHSPFLIYEVPIPESPSYCCSKPSCDCMYLSEKEHLTTGEVVVLCSKRGAMHRLRSYQTADV